MANNVLSAISAAGILVTLVTANNGAPEPFGHRQYHFLWSDGSRCSKDVNEISRKFVHTHQRAGLVLELLQVVLSGPHLGEVVDNAKLETCSLD